MYRSFKRDKPSDVQRETAGEEGLGVVQGGVGCTNTVVEEEEDKEKNHRGSSCLP